jgi:hypothetical protein
VTPHDIKWLGVALKSGLLGKLKLLTLPSNPLDQRVEQIARNASKLPTHRSCQRILDVLFAVTAQQQVLETAANKKRAASDIAKSPSATKSTD